MNYRVLALVLLTSLHIVAATQPSRSQQRAPAKKAAAPAAEQSAEKTAEPAPKISLLDRAAWSCDRDYEHYMQCLREYAAALKEDASVSGQIEYARVKAELATVDAQQEQQQHNATKKITLPGSLVMSGMLEDGTEIYMLCKIVDGAVQVESLVRKQDGNSAAAQPRQGA